MSMGGPAASDSLAMATPPSNGIGLNVETEGKTIGRDDKSFGGKKVRGWAAAVASPHPLDWPEDVWALSPRQADRRSKLAAAAPDDIGTFCRIGVIPRRDAENRTNTVQKTLAGRRRRNAKTPKGL
jgi:hypothetical protein